MKRVYIISLCLLVLILIPFIIWHTQPFKECRISVIDNTASDETNGTVFLLNHLKYKNQSSAPNQLPNNYDDYEVIYFADNYGGLEEKDWYNILNRFLKQDKSLFVAEYNSIAPLTNREVSESITNYLGVNRSGWTGRYFDELDTNKNDEIPQWLIESFADSWNYSGQGFVLVNEIESKVLVLETSKHVLDGGINVSFTKEGEDFFGLNKSTNYNNWFDIVSPKYGSTVLANYNWNLTEKGKELLEENGIPAEFAAVVENNRGYRISYYFAGDYSNINRLPRLYKFIGLQKLYGFLEKNADSAFYWSIYFPMMERVLEHFYSPWEKSISLEYKEKNLYDARIKDNHFQILKDGKWESMIIKGVNLGMGKPGAFPGEAAITEEEYYRWFEYIGEMNASVIRVYTLHPPGFYNSLLRYNENHDKKLYVMHGVWINEEGLVTSQDAFEENTLEDFQQEMKTITDVIHGNRVVQARPGHASGIYIADISKYVIAWVLGIEWDSFMVENTNNIHSSIGDYNGTYFETKGAKPFEYWLAQQMDTIAKYEKENYNYLRPISFTNWPTTDILEHPANFQDNEDLVGVDPNVIYTKEEMDIVGQFASYHVYPYYPDFLNFEEKYVNYVDHRGEKNNYAGYLNHLKSVHRLPILIAEFGIPASRGLTHENPFGLNQGFMSEKEQGEIVSRLYDDILEENMLGGLIFTWQDEWFKRTWNTMDYDNPDRRPFWSNSQTNEQQYGILSFDRHKIRVDGETSEWQTEPLFYKDRGIMKGLYIDHDERYLYIRLDYSDVDNGYPLILLDVVPEQGNYFISGNSNIKFSNGVDFLIDMNKQEPRILIDKYYDFFTYMYAYQLKLMEKPKLASQDNSGIFSQIHYVLSLEYTTDDGKVLMPFGSYETGRLREGNANPDSKDYDSLADFCVNAEGGLELRIPWLLIQSKDPSKKEFIGNICQDGIEASKFVDEIYIGALYVDDKGTVLDSFPGIENNVLNELNAYSWDNWDIPEYKERLKQSYYIIQDLFAD